MGRADHESIDNEHQPKVPHNIDWVTDTVCPNRNITDGCGYQRHSNQPDLIALSKMSFHTFAGVTLPVTRGRRILACLTINKSKL